MRFLIDQPVSPLLAAWQREIKHMEALGVKLELEALSNKNFSFITETYLPAKLKSKQWLD